MVSPSRILGFHAFFWWLTICNCETFYEFLQTNQLIRQQNTHEWEVRFTHFNRCAHLQSEDQSNQVHHHLLVGQLHTQDGQQGEESPVVVLPAVLLLTGQVDVSV